MDTQPLADAILKLAEVHDRRLGEIGAALGRLADQMTHQEYDFKQPEKPFTGIDHLASAVSGYDLSELGDAIRALREGGDED